MMSSSGWLTALSSLAFASLAVLAVAAQDSGGSRIEKDLTLAPGGKFILDADVGSVTLKGTSDSGAHVVITSKSGDLNSKYDISFDQGSDYAKVTVRKKGAHWLWSFSGNLHFEISVPRQTKLDLKTGAGAIAVSGTEGDAGLSTSGGSIEVSSLQGVLQAETSGGGINLGSIRGKAEVSTSGGSIEADSIAGPLKAETSGGGIRISGVTGDLEAETSGGSVHIENAGGHVVASSSGGSVSVSFSAGNAKGGEISSSGGSVSARIDPSVSLVITGDTTGGSARTNLPLTTDNRNGQGKLSGTLGSGGATLTLHTSGGGVSVEAL